MQGNIKWYEPEDTTPKHQCPCCDYITLPERGSLLICPICFCEDDGLDVDELNTHSGPNHLTLRKGRKNFRKYGACHSDMVKSVINEVERSNYRLDQRELK